MILRRVAAAFALSTIVIAGCGGDDDGSDAPADAGEEADPGGEPAAESDEGGGGATGDGVPVDLGGFPIPGPPGGSNVQQIEQDGVTAYNITILAGEFDTVVAFYDEWTSSQPDEYTRIVAAAGGVSWLLSSPEPGQTRSILVSSAVEGQDTTFVSLTDGVTG